MDLRTKLRYNRFIRQSRRTAVRVSKVLTRRYPTLETRVRFYYRKFDVSGSIWTPRIIDIRENPTFRFLAIEYDYRSINPRISPRPQRCLNFAETYFPEIGRRSFSVFLFLFLIFFFLVCVCYCPPSRSANKKRKQITIALLFPAFAWPIPGSGMKASRASSITFRNTC